jgi:NADH-quinone oxidoreductase subunit G
VLRCKNLGISHLTVEGEGKDRRIEFRQENPCVRCGQCTLVCPAFSMREQTDLEKVKKMLDTGNKYLIVQCAPSVRASIGEIFKMEHDPSIEKKLNTALRILGFSKIFDVNFGADITSLVEAEELLERLKDGGVLPMFTSCCPSWVSFVRNYEPQLLANLTTAFSPHIHSGFAYRTWWAEKESLDPANMVIISIMPCTAKKDEIREFNGLRAVDCVLTVRELARLIIERGIDFANLEETEGDSLSHYSGGAVIYGKSGGVMESALRVIKKKVDNAVFENLVTEEAKTGTGESFRKAEINIGPETVKVAVISEPRNFRNFIRSGEYKNYHYVEIMNCSGGCIGGGGQPLLPTRPALEIELMQKRRDILQRIGSEKQKRNALENANATEYVDWVETKDLKHSLLVSPV